MDAITDLNDFAKLPYGDRWAFAFAKNAQLSVAKPGNDFGYTMPNSIPPYFWENIEGTAISDGNTLEGAKIVSALQYYGTDLSTGEMSAAYKASSDSVLQSGGKGVMLASNDVFVANGHWQTGTDRDGSAIDFINVTDKRVTNDDTVTRGEVTNQAIRQVVQLLNGDTYVTYPQGYGIDGKKSPIDGGQY
ncbi:hypothetical protein [Leifsonia sp. NCR5]|uniref:hypothetical protein n=1 Tax=Leifsonia sp. NCR5 TaxID=1978342 RepID=UPI000A196596|nr:hypothetical protein [Leifsonia sp. NCR5]